MRIKILHLTQFLGVGGLEKILFILIKEQIASGHDVTLFVYDSEQSWVKHFREQGIKVINDFRKAEGYDQNFLKYLSDLIEPFDILHTHDINPLMYASPLKFIHTVLKKPFPKLIHTVHGMDHLHRRPITKLYEKVCSLAVNKTIGVSASIKDYYSFHAPLNHNKVVNIDNGTSIHKKPLDKDKVQMRQWISQEFGIPAQNPIWISVARILPLKDQKLLLRAAKQRPRMILLLVGPSGDDSYWDELHKNKPANVFMLGSQDKIQNLLIGSDFFISASHHEGIPVAVLEAGAMSMPCLLSNIQGHLTLQDKTNDPCALFFQTGDLMDLMIKMNMMEQNQEAARLLGHTLRRQIEKSHSSTKMHEDYVKVYREVLC